MKEVGGAREEEEQANKDGGVAKSAILYEFPLFRISYCGTNELIQEAFSFVAKDTDGKWVPDGHLVLGYNVPSEARVLLKAWEFYQRSCTYVGQCEGL